MCFLAGFLCGRITKNSREFFGEGLGETWLWDLLRGSLVGWGDDGGFALFCR